jgi:hypothetical protein
MPIYEFKIKCDHDKVIEVLTSADNRNATEVYCIQCDKNVPAKRILSVPLIKVAYGFSDFDDRAVRKELEVNES